MATSRTSFARASPTISTMRSKVMFSSCVPASSLVAGVKMGCGSFEARCSPGGSLMPQTLCVSRYSFQPEPSR